MKLENVNKLIDNHTFNFSNPMIILVIALSGIFNILTIIYTLVESSFKLMILVWLITIAEIIYAIILGAKRTHTIYSSTASMMILWVNLILTLNTYNYLNQIKIGTYDIKAQLVSFIIQLGFMILGFAFSVWRLKKGHVSKPYNNSVGVYPILVVVLLFKSISRFISNSSVELQNIANLIFCNLLSSYCTFFMGVFQITIIYCIIKYKIPNRDTELKPKTQ